VSDELLVTLLVLASYYVTWVIVHSTIASPLVERWQFFWEDRWVKRHAGPNKEVAARMWESDGWNSKLAYLPTCAWCTGFWVSGAVVGLTSLLEPVPLWPLVWPASAAVIGLLDSLTHHDA